MRNLNFKLWINESFTDIKGEKLKAIREGKGDILKWDGEKLVIPPK